MRIEILLINERTLEFAFMDGTSLSESFVRVCNILSGQISHKS